VSRIASIRHRRPVTARCIAFLSLASLVALACSCGGPKPNPTFANFAGYWKAEPGTAWNDTALRIQTNGDTCAITVVQRPDIPPRTGTVHDGVLSVPTPGGRWHTEFTIDRNGNLVVAIVVDQPERRVSSATTFTPITKDQADALVSPKARNDAIVKGLKVIVKGIEAYHEKHGRYPAAAAVSIKGAAAGFIPAWPTSPIDGSAMRPGSGVANYDYELTGSSFRLIGHLVGGRDVILP
jgi:hypothetical protein